MSFRIMIAIIILVTLLSSAMAEDKATPGIPPTVNYQGILTDLLGAPYPDGGYSLTVRLYDALIGGAVQWQEVIPALVVDGVFSIELGMTNPLDVLDYRQHYWLTTQVNSDPEMAPRIPLTSTPYAFIAGSVDDDVAVKSLNGVQNDVSLVAGPGMTVTPSGQSIILTSTGTGGGADSDWAINGDDMFSIPTGNVGIGTATPEKNLHIVGSGINGTQITLEDVTDPGSQSFQLVLMRFKTALTSARIEVGSTTSGNQYMIADAGGGDFWLTAGEDLRFEHVTRLRIIRDGDDVAEFTDQDEFRMFAEPSGEDVGVIIRGQDPNSGTDGGEILLYDAGGNLGVRLDGYASPNINSTIELYGENNNPGVVLQGQRSPSDKGGAVILNDENGNQALRLMAQNTAGPGDGGSRLNMYHESGGLAVELSAQEDGLVTQGGVLKLYNDLGQLTLELDGDYGSTNEGRVITGVLEITGGSDLSEQFDVSGLEAVLAPGHVVCIDPDRPGELKLSDRAYDTCVAGVISGAGGVRPGMVMGQQGSEADGEYPVALTGRVYVQVDASTGPVKPGDLLTTSDVPGHAMKVADSQKSQGAVLGKAMTSLESGQGLVLVLVSLQ